MANPEHVALVRKGADAIAEWRRRPPRARLDLSSADLSATNLSGAGLRRANLSEADLSLANLSGAKLRRANLSGAYLIVAELRGSDLTAANLSRAYLIVADLRWAALTAADLSGANLTGANLSAVDLRGADLSQAKLGYIDLGDVDLSQVNGLATIKHESPSTIGVDTLIRSVRGAGNKLTPDLTAFFRGAGVPEELLEELPRIVAEVKYHSCFISYGQPDLEFATKLRQELESKGIPCWLYDMDKTVGQPTWAEIEQKLEEYERMVVLCSIDALLRDGVKKEIDKQIDKAPDKLVPVSLENRWTQRGFKAEWGNRDLKTWLKDRNYADFANKPYKEALDELLKGLKIEKPKRKRKKKTD